MTSRPENEAAPPDIIIAGLIRPGVYDDKFKPPAELDIPVEGSLDEAAEPFDLLRDESRDDDDVSAPAGRGSILKIPAFLLTSAALHAAVFLLLFFFAAVPEIAFSGDSDAQGQEIDWVSLYGGGPEPEDVEEPEFEPLEPLNEPEALIVVVEEKEEEPPPPPPPEKKIKKQPVKRDQAPPGPGSPDGQSEEGGGGAFWKALSVPRPAYPEASLGAGEQGLCVIRVVVLPSGQTAGASLLQSSGYRRLDSSALAAARRIRFKLNRPYPPAHSVTVKVPYRFSLKEERQPI